MFDWDKENDFLEKVFCGSTFRYSASLLKSSANLLK